MVTEKTKPIEVLAYTTVQAAQVTGRSHTRIKKAIRERELTARKDGRATLIEHAELVRWISAMPTIGRKPEQATIQPDRTDAKAGAVKGRAGGQRERPTPPRPRTLASRVNALEDNNPRR
jgi:excisionase family DNA binding protein